VREATGLTAYCTGNYAEALKELRAARRLSGAVSYLPIIADCERGLGRPERALEIGTSDDARGLDPAGRAEMRIVAAGARRDMGQLDAALVILEGPDLRTSDAPWAARLRFAYADTLLAAQRTDEARVWFERAADADVDGQTAAAERLAELDGVWFVEDL